MTNIPHLSALRGVLYRTCNRDRQVPESDDFHGFLRVAGTLYQVRVVGGRMDPALNRKIWQLRLTPCAEEPASAMVENASP